MSKKYKILINILLIAIIIVLSILIYWKINEYRSGEDLYKNIRLKNNSKEDLKKVNSDFKFWIKIDGTNINYPVVQTDNNEYYLKNNFLKKPCKLGCIFIDCNNDILKDKNMVIYGHNMMDGSMFNELEKFTDEKFFNLNNKIWINKDNIKYEYEIFSVYIVPTKDMNLKLNFKNNDEFQLYLKKLVNSSMYKKYLDTNSIDKIITLCTCSYEYKKARTIINAKLINKIKD